jgi:hypothetical protein
LTFQIQNNFNHNITVYENINICLARFWNVNDRAKNSRRYRNRVMKIGGRGAM